MATGRSSLATAGLFVATLVVGAAVGGAAGLAIDVAMVQPVVPRAEGTCVAPKEVMRRQHMSMLKHGRDVIVRDGDRAGATALTTCIACHAVRGADGKPVTVASPQHFCRSCHDYAAVKIDCFECHASRPEADGRSAALPDGGTAGLPSASAADVAALAAYAEETRR